jgi:hypothetical protein
VTRVSAHRTPNERSTSPDAPSPYRLALNQTADTVRRRARLYQGTAALVLVVPIVAVITAVVMRSATLLAVALVIVPVFALFRCIDLWLVWRWERRIVALWSGEDFAFAAFRTAAEAMRSLPRRTVIGMLDLLPDDAMIAGPTVPQGLRPALAATIQLIGRADLGADVVRALGRSTLVTSIGLSAALVSWRPALLAGLPALALETTARLIPRIAGSVWQRRIEHAADADQLVGLARRLNWRTVPRPG